MQHESTASKQARKLSEDSINDSEDSTNTENSSKHWICCEIHYYKTLECGMCGKLNPNQPQPTLKRKRKSSPNPNKSAYLVCGYIRNIKQISIMGINKICLEFYGYYYIYIDEDDSWFKSNNLDKHDFFKYSSHRLRTTALIQYVDDKYQIVYGKISGGKIIEWQGYLCINMITNQVHSLILDENKYLKMSEPLILRSIERDRNGKEKAVFRFPTYSTNLERFTAWLKPENTDNDDNDDDDDGDDDDDHDLCDLFAINRCTKIKEFKYNIWRQFYENLWNLFVINRLYDDQKKLKDQEIWYIMQFLWILSDAFMTTPYIILYTNDLFAVFDDYNKTELKFKDKYKTFNLKNDCNAEIIKYKKNKILECKCFMYYENHYWCYSRGSSQRLYEVIFKISKTNNKVDVTFTIHTVFDEFKQENRW